MRSPAPFILSEAKNLIPGVGERELFRFAQDDARPFPENRGNGRERVSSISNVLYKIEAQRSGFDFERKREIADMELSRHFRKPGKRNGASFL